MERSYFRIACEFQIRFRKIDAEELKVFKSHAMRPSPYSSLRMELENQLQNMSIKAESKFLFEKAFQILVNIDQRLERLEEQVMGLRLGDQVTPDSYEWTHGDLGAGGLSFKAPSKSDVQVGDLVLVDILLPSMPEYRLVAAAKVVHLEGEGPVLGLEFDAIHEDDREFIHRYVIQREREMLRNRAQTQKTEK